jgi:alanine dehydrogenase
MAIAPKNPRKRAAKKTPKVKAEVSPETTPVAAVIEAASPDEKKTKPAKKAAVIPVAIFQAAPIAEKAPAKKAPGTVMIDVAVDQGGCFETTVPTTHDHPTYVVDEVIHYTVANMPGAVPRTSTIALTNATLPYAIQLAAKGWKVACAEDKALKKGLNVVDGKVVYKGVAAAFGLPYHEVNDVLR